MRHFKPVLTTLLIILMALPVIAGRRQIKKGVNPMLTSARIALFSSPPRYDEAMAYFDTVLIDYGPIPEAYFYKGNIYAEYASREYEFAGKIEKFELMSAHYDSLYYACESDDVKKKYKDKCDEFTRIVDSIKVFYWSENYNNGVKIIDRIDKELNPNLHSAADSAAEEAARAALYATADSGKGYFGIAIAVNSKDQRSLEGLGLLYDRLRMSDSALVWFERAYEIDSTRISIVQSIAYAYINMQKWAKSIQYLKKVHELEPGDAVTLENIAICFNNLQMPDSAFAYNKKAIKVDTTSAGAFIDVGQYYLVSSTKYRDSANYFKRENNNAEADRYIALENELLDSATVYFGKGVELDPDDVFARERYAIVLMVKGKYEEAAEQFKKLTEMSPNIKDYWINHGDCLLQMQEFEEAMVPYEKGLELDSTDIKLMEVLLDIYNSQQLTEKAEALSAKLEELRGQ